MKTIQLAQLKKVHFIGIGGIGMSAVARFMLGRGIRVSGSDRAASLITDQLTKAGAMITVGQAVEAIPAQCDLIVYTVAIPEDNPELQEAKRRNLPLATYPQMLGVISEALETIAVAGTHGKTTTTAMLASILLEAGFDPTVLLGGLMLDPRQQKGKSDLVFDQAGTNFIFGKSKYFVVEADEYKKSFHNLAPRILIITNIDADHLDFYNNLADVQHAFAELAEKVPPQGFIICNPNDPHTAPVLKNIQAKIINYTAEKIPTLQVPGAHNRANAMAAAAAASVLGVKPSHLVKALEQFPGTWRRFQFKGLTKNGARVYDDYAHNPQKVAAAIAGARESFPQARLIAVFQPHLYSRTKHFFAEFVQALRAADQVILLPIYAAREKPDPTISSGMLAESLRATVQPSNATAQAYLEKNAKTGDIILVMGAGDSTHLAEILVK